MMTLEQRQEIIRLLEKGEKREYELVYHGKEREEDIIANTLAVPLQPVRTFGTNGSKANGDWQNMLIFGDNLQGMKSLLEMKKAGKLCNSDGTHGARLICIDPPFATKQEFRGSQDQKAYQDKIAGAKFIEFLRKRLVLLRELLSNDGSIYLHLDWKKSHYVKTIMDEIFEEQNFLNEIVWKRTRAQHSDAGRFGNVHDSLLVYSKSQSHIFNPQYVPHKPEYLVRFNKVEAKGRKY